MGDVLIRELNRILARALKRFGEAGHAEESCELAAEAWSLLRETHPKEAERMNGLLHALTRTKCQGNGEPDLPDGDFDLEVRHLEPAKRHELIIETYHKLKSGQGYILINDHDPKPLYYQFSFEYPDAFTWDPVESGPQVWRVRIGKP